MRIRILLLLLGISFLDSCNRNDSALETKKVTFTEIGKGTLSGSEEISKSNVKITNSTDWQNLISKMNTINNVSNRFTEININFDEFMIFAIFLDVKPNGWEVEIRNVVENDKNIIISKIETGYNTTVITQPFHIIKIPKSTKPIIVE